MGSLSNAANVMARQKDSNPSPHKDKVAIPYDFLGTKHTNFAFDLGMFFRDIILVTWAILTRQSTENVIVKVTCGISKSKEPLYRFWEHSSTVLVEIGTDRKRNTFEIE